MRERGAGAVPAFDAEWVGAVRAGSMALVEFAVWGEISSARLGAVERLRKRALELGAKLRSLCNDRAWIPHPREQLKSALAGALAVSEALAAVDASVCEMNGGRDLAALQQQHAALARRLDGLRERSNCWAAELEALNGGEPPNGA